MSHEVMLRMIALYWTETKAMARAHDQLMPNIDVPTGAEEPAAEATQQDRQVITLVRVPNVALGKVLDGGRDGAHAAKLLAIKAFKNQSKPSWALNERYCRCHYRVSRRAFKAGLAHAKKCGVLQRELHGRSYATEEPLAEGSGGFVLLDEALLPRSSAFVASVLAVNLSADPQPPAKVARRIGVKSTATVRKLTRQAASVGAIAVSSGSRGAVLVARRGFNFDLVKNDPVKNDPVKIGPAHRGKKGRHSNTEGSAPSNVNILCNATRLRAERDFQNNFQDEIGALEDRDWMILAPWQNSRGIADRELHATKPPEVFMSLAQWKWWLNAFGVDIPGHLKTPAAHRQALEIANELISHPTGNFFGHEAMEALAFWVAKACADGRKVRSFGFIAERILGQLDNEDTTAIHDRPSHKDEGDLDEAHQLAIEMVAELEGHEFPASRASLLSTSRIEGLVDLLEEHGRDAFVRGFNHCMDIKRRPAEGHAVYGWNWFEDDITASRRKKRRRAA